MPRLLAIDPGKATGLAYGYYHDDTPYELWKADTLHEGVSGMAFAYWNGGLFDDVDEVLLEGYTVRPGRVGDPIALEVIGFIKGVCERPLIMRQPSDKGKAGVFDSVLKEHGLWQTGKMVNHTDGRDANDTIIHSLRWLIFKEKHQPTIDRYMT